MAIKEDIISAAKRVYSKLGAGHEEVIYREAMSMELQDLGFTVKTEMPVAIDYQTSKGHRICVGYAKSDLRVEGKGEVAIVELKATGPLIKEKSTKAKEEMKEYAQLEKYLAAIGGPLGLLINFPFPPRPEPEVFASDEE